VILCTDGDFNVGVTGEGDLTRLIEEKAKSGVFLTVLGFGMGNYKDDTLELLADKGNGNYGYVDSTREARKVLVDGASGTLMTIAKDVKVQVEFNPATVAGYRLVGYDNRLLATKDFNDDTKDAGEIGAGHTVTAFYEIVPVGVDEPLPEARTDVDPLRYGQPPAPAAAAPGVPAPPPPPAVPASAAVPSSDPTSRELLTVKLRFKAPEGDVSTKREFPLTDGGAAFDKASPDFQFASAVAAFALILKQSTYRGTASLDTVLELAGSSLGNDPGGWRAEFVDLVKKAKSLSGTK
jgi:Ca-activated chloride channel family protein